MKFLKLFIPASVILFFFFFTGTPFSGCRKTNTTDTVTIVKHDTTIVVDSVYDISSGLVAYYNFNNGSLKDSSGYGNDIVYNNATTTADRFGRAGNAYAFNGTSTYMQVRNSASINPDNITLFSIVKVSGFYPGSCHVNQILGKGYSDYINGFYEMRFTDLPLNCGDPVDSAHEKFTGIFGDNNGPGGASVVLDTAFVQKGVWYTLAYTYDGMTARLYVNGVLKTSFAKSITFTDNSYDLFIGHDENPLYPYWLNGVIDEIRIYNRALPQGAITQLNKLKN